MCILHKHNSYRSCDNKESKFESVIIIWVQLCHIKQNVQSPIQVQQI